MKYSPGDKVVFKNPLGKKRNGIILEGDENKKTYHIQPWVPDWSRILYTGTAWIEEHLIIKKI